MSKLISNHAVFYLDLFRPCFVFNYQLSTIVINDWLGKIQIDEMISFFCHVVSSFGFVFFVRIPRTFSSRLLNHHTHSLPLSHTHTHTYTHKHTQTHTHTCARTHTHTHTFSFRMSKDQDNAHTNCSTSLLPFTSMSFLHA